MKWRLWPWAGWGRLAGWKAWCWGQKEDCQEGSRAASPDSSVWRRCATYSCEDPGWPVEIIPCHNYTQTHKGQRSSTGEQLFTWQWNGMVHFRGGSYLFFYWALLLLIMCWSDQWQIRCCVIRLACFCGWLPVVALPPVWGRLGAGCLAGPACCGWPWQRRSEPRTWRPCSAGLCPSLPGPLTAVTKGLVLTHKEEEGATSVAEVTATRLPTTQPKHDWQKQTASRLKGDESVKLFNCSHF